MIFKGANILAPLINEFLKGIKIMGKIMGKILQLKYLKSWFDTPDNIRTSSGFILMFIISVTLYIMYPVKVYIFTIIISLLSMIYDYFSSGFKSGVVIDILKWIFLIPIINLLPLLLIPVFSVINPISKLLER